MSDSGAGVSTNLTPSFARTAAGHLSASGCAASVWPPAPQAASGLRRRPWDIIEAVR